MKLGFYSVLFSKHTQYGKGQKYIKLLIIFSMVSAAVKLSAVAFAISTFFDESININWYFLLSIVILVESITSLILYKKMKNLSAKQASSKKNQMIYEVFEGFHLRHVAISHSRLFTNVFIILMVWVIILVAYLFNNLGDIYAYLNNFSSIIVIVLIFFDAIYLQRNITLSRKFSRSFHQEINRHYWQECQEKYQDLKLPNFAKLYKKRNVKFLDLEKINCNKLRKIYFSDFDCFLRLVDKHGKKINKLKFLLDKCPGCGADAQLMVKNNEIKCLNCGMHWKFTNGKILNNTNNDIKFENFYQWFTWQEETIKKAIDNNDYGFSERGFLWFLAPEGKFVCLGEGSFLQEKIKFYFLSDDGVRVDFDTTKLNSLPFVLNEGLFLYDGKFVYLVALPHEYDCVKVNLALAEFKKHQNGEIQCDT